MDLESQNRRLYLDLLERCLTNTIYEDPAQGPFKASEFESDKRAEGKDWPATAHTMIGSKRLRNLRSLCEDVLREGVPGDFIETGVWRGGACILMRGILAAYADHNRRVWVADSFCGLPEPDADAFPADRGDTHHSLDALRVTRDEVAGNFARYGLLDAQVEFLEGWFKDTLPPAPITELAILRLDGDMYQSTFEALETLYPKLSAGGYVIVDDYGAVPASAEAVHDYLQRENEQVNLLEIDWTGRYWKKPGGPNGQR